MNKETITKIINLRRELSEIKAWFNAYYTPHEQKYNRLISLNRLLDDDTSPQIALNSLYIDAEDKRKQYQELESELLQLQEELICQKH